MTTPPRSFRRAVEKKARTERPTVVFTLDWVDDENDEVIRSDEFHATMPTEESLFLLMATAGDDEMSAAAEAASIMGIFKDSLPPEEYSTLRMRLRDPEDDVSLEVLQEVIPWLMEQWTTFPTQPPAGSSGTRRTTGGNSTGRVRGKGSTSSPTTS